MFYTIIHINNYVYFSSPFIHICSIHIDLLCLEIPIKQLTKQLRPLTNSVPPNILISCFEVNDGLDHQHYSQDHVISLDKCSICAACHIRQLNIYLDSCSSFFTRILNGNNRKVILFSCNSYVSE